MLQMVEGFQKTHACLGFCQVQLAGLQLHGKFCSRCTYNGAKIGAKESKCTSVSDPSKYALIGGTVGECSVLPAFC